MKRTLTEEINRNKKLMGLLNENIIPSILRGFLGGASANAIRSLETELSRVLNRTVVIAGRGGATLDAVITSVGKKNFIQALITTGIKSEDEIVQGLLSSTNMSNISDSITQFFRNNPTATADDYLNIVTTLKNELPDNVGKRYVDEVRGQSGQQSAGQSSNVLPNKPAPKPVKPTDLKPSSIEDIINDNLEADRLRPVGDPKFFTKLHSITEDLHNKGKISDSVRDAIYRQADKYYDWDIVDLINEAKKIRKEIDPSISDKFSDLWDWIAKWDTKKMKARSKNLTIGTLLIIGLILLYKLGNKVFPLIDNLINLIPTVSSEDEGTKWTPIE